jgi:hypothetical protein
MLSDLAQKEVTRYIVNGQFNHAVLLFTDDSRVEFEHSSRSNRWARASADGTAADRVCRTLAQFRLNAKHLQLFFEDGSNIEFFAKVEGKEDTSDGSSL